MTWNQFIEIDFSIGNTVHNRLSSILEYVRHLRKHKRDQRGHNSKRVYHKPQLSSHASQLELQFYHQNKRTESRFERLLSRRFPTRSAVKSTVN